MTIPFESFSASPQAAILFTAIAVGCYFIGNINPAILIGKAYGVDVRREGSGNAGMTNAMRTIGKKAGVVTFIIDMAKGLIPVVILFQAIPDIGGVSLIPGGAAEIATADNLSAVAIPLQLQIPFGALCGVLVIVGHIWPVVYKFRGGKGVSTCFGVLLALDWRLALIMLAIVLLAAVVTKRVSAGTLIACACAIPVSFLLGAMNIFAVLVIILLIVWSHRANIVRLAKGTEPKMSFGNKE
jgi:glycerol-3-phosphate acyltransferase PlsY